MGGEGGYPWRRLRERGRVRSCGGATADVKTEEEGETLGEG
jgi:hypothetical protein